MNGPSTSNHDPPPRQWTRLNRRQCLLAVMRAWRPLVLYQLLASLVIAAAVWPWLLTLSYTIVGLSGQPALGDFELIRFLLTPRGALSFFLFAGILVALVLVEYSGLIVLAEAAIRGRVLAMREFLTSLAASAPRLLVMALIALGVAIATALPFAALGSLVYGWMLGGADFYFYWTERPARFWMAAAVGGLLAAIYACCLVWLFVRWAFAVPACAIEGRGWRESLAESSRRSRGHRGRLLLTVAAWLLLKYATLLVIAAALDQLGRALVAGANSQLWRAIWSTVSLLLLDAVVLQLVAAVFAIGLGVILAIEYEQTRESLAVEQLASARRPASGVVRIAVFVALLLGPLGSLATGLLVARRFVDHRPMRVTAHRAGPAPAPENSLAALRLGVEAGADDVEIDVQQTADGHVVLVHDRDLRRVTGDTRDVANVTLADLAELRLLQDDRRSDERIPTLAEFLDACPDGLRVNVEMKDFGRGADLGPAVAKVLREQGFVGRAVTSSFQMPPLLAARRTEPKLLIGAILSTAKGDVTQLPVDFLSLNRRLVNAQRIRRAHRRGLEVHVWGVNDRETALRMLDLGCDNIITRDPALVRGVVDEYAALTDVERMLLRLRRWMRE